ncbi:MAG: DUF1579 domain-containing protein [bacterium]|nr:DUF1579 domain-containing protein [bacterium]
MVRKLFVLFAVTSCFALSFAQEGNSPSEADMMKIWMEMSTPGEAHAGLAKMAGEWDCVTKFAMGPGQPMMESKGSCTNTVVNGGRAVRSTFHGDMMGMPFEGEGLTGYDNFNKTYWSTWMDNMSTGFMFMEGTSTDGGKTVVFNTTMDEPTMNVKDKPVRMVSKILDENTHVFESWDEIGTPHEFKAMEITYTRKK